MFQRKNQLLSLFILFSFALFAQETPFISHFSRKDYQGLNQNWSLGQSSDGFIFSANSAGLLVADGQNWRKFELPKGQIIRSLSVSSQNKVFTGSVGTFGYWEKDKFGHFHYIDLAANNLDSLHLKEEFWHILEKNNDLYFQSFSVIYKWNNKKVSRITPPGNIMFLQKVGNKIVVPVIGKGLFLLNEENNTFSWIKNSEILQNETISFILQDKADWLIGTQLAGVFRYNGRVFTPWENPLNKVLKQKQLNKAIRLKDGSLALGTVLDGLFIMDLNGQLKLHLNKENGLQNNTILSLFEDKLQNLWVGLDKGIDLIHRSSPLSYYHDTKGVLGTVYTALMDGNLFYVGTNQGVFVKNKVDKKPFSFIEGTQGQVWQLLKQNNILLCGHNSGTFLFENGKPKLISNITGGWSFCEIPGKKNELLQSTYTGLALFTFQNNQWTFNKRLDGLNEPIRKILPAGDNYFWALHANNGLYKLKIEWSKGAIVSQVKLDKKDGLSDQTRLDIRFFRDTLLVHSRDMNYYFDETSQRFYPWKENSMEKGAIWLEAENEGFTYKNNQLKHWKNNEIKAIHPISMIPENEHIVNLNKEELFVGLEDGYALIPKNKYENTFLRNIIFSPLLSELKAQAKDGKQVELNWVNIGKTEGVEIPPSGYNLSVKFGFPSFESGVLFRFRLIGWQDNWSSWQVLRSLNWNNLSPGDYILEIQANVLEASYAGATAFNMVQGVRGSPNLGWGFNNPSDDLVRSYEPGDPRRDATVLYVGEVLPDGSGVIEDNPSMENERYNQKAWVESHPGLQDNGPGNIRILRYADVLLIAAEALNELNNPTEALKYLNQVRQRARGTRTTVLPDVVFSDKLTLRERIWKERRIELAMEQQRWFDLVRTGQAEKVLKKVGKNFIKGKHDLFPIPQTEIDLSEGKMTQNPGY